MAGRAGFWEINGIFSLGQGTSQGRGKCRLADRCFRLVGGVSPVYSVGFVMPQLYIQKEFLSVGHELGLLCLFGIVVSGV